MFANCESCHNIESIRLLPHLHGRHVLHRQVLGEIVTDQGDGNRFNELHPAFPADVPLEAFGHLDHRRRLAVCHLNLFVEKTYLSQHFNQSTTLSKKPS